MPTNVSEAVRAIYERRPYPALTRAALRRPAWRLPAADWIKAVAQAGPDWPRRVLVAGCGTGLEAFAVRRRFPKTEVVGVDFAARSIAVAQRWQKTSARWRDIRFLRADLTSDRLAKITGGDFDFISCHGVMSYLPEPMRALRGLANCLRPAGVLYLGVNGATHFSAGWRRFLSAFGIDMQRWSGGERLWRHLKFAAPLAADPDGEVLKHGAGYLAADLFGSLIHNLPLADWVRMCRQAGLHFRGNSAAHRLVWPAINDGSYELFLPRGRGEVAELLDILQPGAFYRLVFTRSAEPRPPWRRDSTLRQWRPLRTEHLRRFKWPARRGARLLKIENRRANIAIELRSAGWEIDLLRESNGERSLQEILAGQSRRVTPAALRSQLYLFYLLDLLNFLPPAARGKMRCGSSDNSIGTEPRSRPGAEATVGSETVVARRRGRRDFGHHGGALGAFCGLSL